MSTDDFIARFAAGETDDVPPAPGTGGSAGESSAANGVWPDTEPGADRSSEGSQIDHDKLESPGSERETEQKQRDPVPDAVEEDPDIDESQINAVPGTGGPDDVGDVEVDPRDLNLPGTGHS